MRTFFGIVLLTMLLSSLKPCWAGESVESLSAEIYSLANLMAKTTNLDARRGMAAQLKVLQKQRDQLLEMPTPVVADAESVNFVPTGNRSGAQRGGGNNSSPGSRGFSAGLGGFQTSNGFGYGTGTGNIRLGPYVGYYPSAGFGRIGGTTFNKNGIRNFRW